MVKTADAEKRAATSAVASSTGRVFGYGRVSTSDQTSENQRVELEAAGYAIKAARWFADSISGKVPAMQRPQFAKLVDRIEAGDTLVVSKLDRIGRDMLDVEATIGALEGRGVAVVVLQLGSTDLTSSAGKLIRRVLGAVAAMERELLVERTQAGLRRAMAEGKVLGRPSKTTEAQKADIRRRAAAGETVSALAREYGISRASVLSAVRHAALFEGCRGLS